MTDQHRATPHQWAAIEEWGTEEMDNTASCLLELRARVEALEKARPQAWEAPPGIEPLLPRSELATRITEAVKREPYGTAGVRAVIHAVADWLDERDTSIQNDPDCLEAPFADDAIRWLRDEANK